MILAKSNDECKSWKQNLFHSVVMNFHRAWRRGKYQLDRYQNAALTLTHICEIKIGYEIGYEINRLKN